MRGGRIERGGLARAAVLAFVCMLGLLAFAGSALAAGHKRVARDVDPDGPSGYYVTFVALSCPDYTDIFANKARNDIMESLKRPRPRLAVPGQRRADQPGLREPSRRRTSARRSRGGTSSWVPGSRAALTPGCGGRCRRSPTRSTRTSPPRSSTPLLNQNAQPIGNKTIRARPRSSSPTPSASRPATAARCGRRAGCQATPSLVNKFPGPEYGFGALRCATDDLNGDNVEYIYFPAGYKHVFCYGIYVKPPPTSGEITIQKQVVGEPAGTSPTFPFNGDLSFDPNGFNLGDGGS